MARLNRWTRGRFRRVDRASSLLACLLAAVARGSVGAALVGKIVRYALGERDARAVLRERERTVGREWSTIYNTDGDELRAEFVRYDGAQSCKNQKL